MAEQPIYVAPPQEEEIYVEPPIVTAVVSPETAAEVAKSTKFAFPTFEQQFDTVYANILNGGESTLRRDLAARSDYANSQIRAKVVQGMAEKYASLGEPIPPELFKKLQSDIRTPTDPKSVIEEYYGKAYVEGLRKYKDQPDSLLAEVYNTVPEAADEAMSKASDVVTKREYLRRKVREMQDVLKNQGWGGFIVDQALMLSQVYQEAKLRGYMGTSAFEKLDLGSSLDEQSFRLYSLPMNQFKTSIDKVLDKLSKDNPSLALFYANAMVGQSTSDRVLNNIGSALALTGISTATKFGTSAARAVKMRNAAVDAAKTYVKQIDSPRSLPEVMAEASGDMAEASAQTIARRALDNISKTADGGKESVENLVSVLRGDIDYFRSNPGRSLAGEAVARIETDTTNYVQKIENTIGSVARVGRLGVLEGGDDIAVNAARKIAEDSKARFQGRGMGDAFIDQRITYNPAANVHFEHIIFGNPHGHLFVGVDGEQAAKLFAQQHFEFARTERTQFKVGRTGSTYEVTPSGTTIRTLSATEQAAEKRIKDLKPGPTTRPESAKTVLIEPADTAKLKPFLDKKGNLEKGLRIVDTGNSIRVVRQSIKESKILETIPYGASAAVGKHPLQLFSKGKDTFGALHLSRDAITEITPGYRIDSKIDYTVEQTGGYWYIRVTRPLDETRDVIRDVLLDTPKALTPETKLKSVSAYLGRIRTPDETLSLAQREERKTATYSPNVLRELFKDEFKEIAKMAKGTWPFTDKRKQWKDWERTVNFARTAKDPNNPESTGAYFFRSVQELEGHYAQHFGRMPTEAEARAYFAYARLAEGDRILRNLEVYKDKTRLGVQSYTYKMVDGRGNTLTSPSFDARRLNYIPGGEGTILLTGTHFDRLPKKGGSGGEKIIRANTFLNEDEYKATLDAIKEGRLHVLEIYDEEIRPLAGFSRVAGNARVQYVIAPATENKPISWAQVTDKGNSLFDQTFQFYVAQGKIAPETVGKKLRYYYEGDNFFTGTMLRSQATALAKHIDEVRLLIKDNKFEEARAYAMANLPVEWSTLRGLFQESRGVDGRIIPPKLDVNEPFKVIGKNERVIDVDASMEKRYVEETRRGQTSTVLIDGTRKGLARENLVQYTKDPNEVLYAFQDVGTKGKPIWDIAPTQYVDAIPAMNRAINKIVNTTYLDDYKITSMEHWLREAMGNGDPNKSILKASEEDVRRSPLYHFNTAFNPESLKPAAEALRVQQLKTVHYQIKQLMGVKSETEKAIYTGTQKILDSIYGTFGPKATLADPSAFLSKVSDPVGYIRSMAFHVKLGMFNIPQLIIQAQTYSTIMGIAGFKYAAPGAKASLLHRYAAFNASDSVLDKIDEMMTSNLRIPGTARWRPGEWKEAYQALKTTGFDIVAGEHIFQDDVFSQKMVATGFGRFLDWGTFFFKEGERQVRLGAWYTAFKEFRDASPTGRLTPANIKQILERADLLSVNMSRASASAVHKGVLSIPTQFLSYQLRNMELFTGKRLSGVEKARMFAWQAALYGFPTSLGITALPVGEILRKAALDNGYDPQASDPRAAAIMEGVPALIGQLVTGNAYNIGDRYGLQGLDIIKDIVRGEKTMMDVLGGASFSMFKEAVEGFDPYWKATAAAFRDSDDYSMTVEHALRPLRGVSTVNTAHRLWEAIDTGRWMSKKGMYLDDSSSVANSIFMSTFGLQPQGVADSFLKQETTKDRKTYNDKTEQLFTQEWRRYLMAARDGDTSNAEIYQKNAIAILGRRGYPEVDRAKLFALASDDAKSLRDRADWDRVNKEREAKERLRQMEIYQRIQGSK